MNVLSQSVARFSFGSSFLVFVVIEVSIGFAVLVSRLMSTAESASKSSESHFADCLSLALSSLARFS